MRALLSSLALALLAVVPHEAASLPVYPDGWSPAAGGESRQTVGPRAKEPASTIGAAGPGAQASSLVSPADTVQAGLVKVTLPLDISTASFYELVDWVRSLGLSDSGGSEDLRARLYTYYGVEAPQAVAAGGRTVNILSADQADYSGDAKGDKGVVSLSGGVRLSVSESSGDSYTISARKVVYDRGNNSLYASGSVVYTRTSQGRSEEFRGSTLAADLDDWSGLFLDGVWRQQGASLGTGDRGLVFSSSTLNRRPGNFISLDKATVSPGSGDTPNFSIRADKLWFLGESDWAALSALIYVGEVPVLWLPFFYNPSEEIIFHPVFGFRSREGSFLQTTTWLLGQKPPAASSSTIIQFSQASGPTEARGIFLKHLPSSQASGASSSASPAPSSVGAEATTGGAAVQQVANADSLMLLADWYVGLGGFLGFDASLKPRGILSKFSVQAGLGESRSLFPGLSGLYSPYSSAGNWYSVWNGSDFFGIGLPFRFGGQVSAGLTLGSLKASVDLPLYSDSYFEQDFRDRSFDMDWLGMAKTTTQTSTIAVRSSLAQKLSLSGSLPVTALSPWVQSLSVAFNSSFSWLAKADSNLSGTESSGLYAYDPARQFFYPDSLRPVDLTFNLAGTLLDLPASSGGSAAKGSAAKDEAASATGAATSSDSAKLPGLRSPWSGTKEGGDDSGGSPSAPGLSTAEQVFPAPATAPDPSLPASVLPFSSKISWTFQPGLVLERRFLSDSWKGLSDVNYDPLYDLESWKLGASLSSSLAILGNALTGSYNLTWSQQEQARQATKDSAYAGTTQALALSDAQYPQRKLSGSLRLASQPIPAGSIFSASSLSWSLDSLLYSWNFDHFSVTGDPTTAVYSSTYPSWTTDSVTANTLGLTLVAKTGSSQQSLGLTASLPPLAESYSANLALAANAGDWTLSLGGQEKALRQSSGPLLPSPLSASGKIGMPLGFSLSDNATWDFDQGGLSSNVANATWGWASATLQSQYGQVLVPVKDVGWQAVGSPAFIPSSFSFNLAPRLDPPKDADWQPTLSASLSYAQNLLRFSDSVINLGLSLDLKLGSGFSLSFSSQSQNRNAWRYWPQFFSIPTNIGTADQLRINPLTDILNSLSVFDSTALTKGNFKLKSLSFKLSQDLEDWTLAATGTATPTLDSTGSYWYINPSFSLTVAWKDISAIKSAIVYQNNALSW
ncbi:MAG TPA: hypothetical protein VMV44_00135 [Rectinemataceae bacterium]|nr:hypothetical protein [Rectinemataceae bacterium]